MSIDVDQTIELITSSIYINDVLQLDSEIERARDRDGERERVRKRGGGRE